MKKRQGNRRLPNRKDTNGDLLCLIPTCNNLRVYGNGSYKNKLRNYCEKHNFWNVQKFINWQALRLEVLKRDKYTCKHCGKKPLKDSNRKGQKRQPNTSALVGDHIIPIALGGNEFDPKNVQTLCKDCDKIKTTQDHKDIAKARRLEKFKQNSKILKEVKL